MRTIVEHGNLTAQHAVRIIIEHEVLLVGIVAENGIQAIAQVFSGISYDGLLQLHFLIAKQGSAPDDKLEQEKSKSAATEDDMFVTEDPYGTNTTSLYVYFTTDDSVSVSYTVHADGYADFTRDAYQQSQYSKTHEFQILGLIPREKNTLTITLTNADGKSRTHTFGQQYTFRVEFVQYLTWRR